MYAVLSNSLTRESAVSWSGSSHFCPKTSVPLRFQRISCVLTPGRALSVLRSPFHRGFWVIQLAEPGNHPPNPVQDIVLFFFFVVFLTTARWPVLGAASAWLRASCSAASVSAVSWEEAGVAYLPLPFPGSFCSKCLFCARGFESCALASSSFWRKHELLRSGWLWQSIVAPHLNNCVTLDKCLFFSVP